MKRLMVALLCLFILLAFVGCGNNSKQQTGDLAFHDNTNQNNAGQENTGQTDEEQIDTEQNKILIAYFSRVGNTDFPDGVDAIASASLIVKDGEVYGNTQYIATLIQQATNGDLFLIETEDKYPADYDDTDKQGVKESKKQSRPKLASHIENMGDYDTVYLGFPNWYYGTVYFRLHNNNGLVYSNRALYIQRNQKMQKH